MMYFVISLLGTIILISGLILTNKRFNERSDEISQNIRKGKFSNFENEIADLATLSIVLFVLSIIGVINVAIGLIMLFS